MDGAMKVVVGGVLSLPPFSSGTAWDRLHYVLGLRDLGHEVLFVEEVQPDWCFDSRGRRCDYAPSANRAAFQAVMSDFGLQACSCQLYDGGRATAGLSLSRLRSELAGADVLINISGHVKSDVMLDAVGRRAYLDQDPVYTQLWDAEYGAELGLDDHDVLFTVGANVGTPLATVPDGGRRWHHCLPPVLLDYWPYRFDPRATRFTTVASWGRYADLRYKGREYGSKQAEFMRFAPLPRRTGEPFELALRGGPAGDDLAAVLAVNGWTLRDGAELSTLRDYQHFIAGSRAEIAITKGAYATGRAGWLGDRSAQYLASGKPVLSQSTGLEHAVPVGRGLVTFSTLADAVAGAEMIAADYSAHCRAARGLAEEHLDHRTVLPPMLETAMSSTRANGRTAQGVTS
jgi:hypothetical protein